MLMHHPILVRHINHLTDARYFSAAGADWLSLDISADAESLSRFHAIRDWVEGVSIAAEPVRLGEEMWARLIIDARPEGLLVAADRLAEVPPGIRCFVEVGSQPDGSALPGEVIRIFRMDDISDWVTQGIRDKDFIETAWTPEAVRRLLESGYNGGFCLRGGREDQTGVKDFTELDEVIGLLRP